MEVWLSYMLRVSPDRSAAGGDKPVAGSQDGDDEQHDPPHWMAGRQEHDPDHYSDQGDEPAERGALVRLTGRHG